MPTIGSSTGISIYYEWHGPREGTPVLFIRGTGADSSRWLPQVQAYAPYMPCIIFDNRGCGRSDAPAGPYTVAMMAQDALALLDHLGVTVANLSGLSLGGAIAQHMAIEWPDRVATLQLHGTWARTRGYATFYLSLLKRLLDEGGLNLYYEGSFLHLFPPSFFNDQFERATEILAGMKSHAGSVHGLDGQLQANLSHDELDRLRLIQCPTLITVGELDMALPPEFSLELHKAIPGSELVIFPGGSHLFGLQDPEFNRVTLGWLNRQLGDGHAGPTRSR
jgi:pimeloyl-ACP methyl ester carboxylesterase